MDDNDWRLLLQHAAGHFDDLTLKRGYQLHRQVELTPPLDGMRTVDGVVTDLTPRHVRLDMDDFDASGCTCHLDKPCRHIAAAMMAYAREAGRQVAALANAKSPAPAPAPRYGIGVAARPPAASPASGGTAAAPETAQALRRRDAEARIRQQAARIPELSVAEWQALFALCLAPLEDQTRGVRYYGEALAALEAIKPKLPADTELIYELNVRLCILGKFVTHREPSWHASFSFLGYQSHDTALEALRAIAVILEKPLPLPAGSAQWARIDETLELVRREMVASRRHNYFLTPYFGLWSKWIAPQSTGPDRFVRELEALRALEPEDARNFARAHYLLAASRMHYYLGDDAEALRALEEADNADSLAEDVVMAYAEEIADTGDWHRLIRWLPALGRLASDWRRASIEAYMQYWELAVPHVPEAEGAMWDTLIDLLPRSRDTYESMLMAHGRLRQWMDFLLSSGTDPLEYRVSVFQPVEKEAPELLLPFYHQAIERYVNERNRAGYKTAVKLLKRLFKVYKKLKREDRWEQFFTAFTGKHSRLRALNEELRRGKLLS